MSKFIDRTGEIGYNKQGEKMIIIAYKNNADIDIQFEDGTKLKWMYYEDYIKKYGGKNE